MSDDQAPVHADVNYEKTDAGPAALMFICGGLFAFCVVAIVLSAWLFGALKASTARDDVQVAPLAAKERPKLPHDIDRIPPPRLQIEETQLVKELRQKDENRLNSYGWVDAKKGIVHIPLAEAARLLAEPDFAKTHGLPTEEPQGKAPAKGGGQ